MEMIGLDLHKRESQLCIRAETGELVERRVLTGRAAFAVLLGARRRARVLLEAKDCFG